MNKTSTFMSRIMLELIQNQSTNIENNLGSADAIHLNKTYKQWLVAHKKLANDFFSEARNKGTNLSNGVVETPDYVARYMAYLALENYFKKDIASNKKLKDIKWHDPCVGIAAFPIAILKIYQEHLGKEFNSVESLPQISMVDISKNAILSSLSVIELFLEQHNLVLSEYLESGRLSYNIIDELSLRGENDFPTNHEEKFDIVIGNPPYVRSTRLDQSYRSFLKERFPSCYQGSADLYTYFIASGLNALNPSGVLTFISPASFFRSQNGSAIRNYICEDSCIETVIDLDELPVFPDANIHAAIYSIKKEIQQPSKVKYAHLHKKEHLRKIDDRSLKFKKVRLNTSLNGGWSFFEPPKRRSGQGNLFDNCKPLSEFGINVYSGIRTGCSTAYVLDRDDLENFSDDIRHNWIKELILPSKIEKWTGYKKKNYLLFIPLEAQEIPAEIIDFLSPYRDKLENRTEVKKSDDWLKFRSCSYYKEMQKRKITFPDLSAQQRFSITNAETFVLDGSYFIDSEDLSLLGILNSSLANSYFKNTCSSVGNLNSRGRFRFKKAFVQNFPLPINFYQENDIRGKIIDTVNLILTNGEQDKYMKKLNSLVFDLYETAT